MKLSLNAAHIVGNHSLYISFDTLENSTLMEGTEQSNFEALVLGPVSISITLQSYCVQTKIDQSDNTYGDHWNTIQTVETKFECCSYCR